jgi:aspartyl/glutamyl-tRNA(Asn/Gln) amidotransferase C subunit
MSQANLTSQDIQRLAKLSAVVVTQQEAALFATQFEETLKHVDNLNEIDISDVSQSIHLSAKQNVMFEDGTVNGRLLTLEQATSNAKNVEDGSFVVDKLM